MTPQSRMPFEEFRRQLDLMRAYLEVEGVRIQEHGDSRLVVNVQLSAIQIVEESAHEMADNGEVFEA